MRRMSFDSSRRQICATVRNVLPVPVAIATSKSRRPPMMAFSTVRMHRRWQSRGRAMPSAEVSSNQSPAGLASKANAASCAAGE